MKEPIYLSASIRRSEPFPQRSNINSEKLHNKQSLGYKSRHTQRYLTKLFVDSLQRKRFTICKPEIFILSFCFCTAVFQMCYLHNSVYVKVQGDKGRGLFVLGGFTGGGSPSSPQQRHSGEPKTSEPDSPHSCCSSADTRKGFSQQEGAGGLLMPPQKEGGYRQTRF